MRMNCAVPFAAMLLMTVVSHHAGAHQLLEEPVPAGESATQQASPVGGGDITHAELLQVRAGLEAELDTSGRYSHLRERDKVKVRKNLDDMAKLLVDAERASALPLKQRTELLNLQHQVNGILTEVDPRDRMSCHREHRVGTNRHHSRCSTRAERDKNARDSHDDLREGFHRRNQLPLGN